MISSRLQSLGCLGFIVVGSIFGEILGVGFCFFVGFFEKSLQIHFLRINLKPFSEFKF